MASRSSRRSAGLGEGTSGSLRSLLGLAPSGLQETQVFPTPSSQRGLGCGEYSVIGLARRCDGSGLGEYSVIGLPNSCGCK